MTTLTKAHTVGIRSQYSIHYSMGNRLSKIYTRTGDQGDTGLGDGSRIAKTHLRIEAMGDVDELNSVIGLINANLIDNAIKQCLLEIQHDLFDLGGELCIPDSQVINSEHVSHLELQLDDFNEDLPYLKEFILPGGNNAAAYTHLARSICRRAERSCLKLHAKQTLNMQSLAYLNRLSDLLFVLARVIARRDGQQEILWNRDRFTPGQTSK